MVDKATDLSQSQVIYLLSLYTQAVEHYEQTKDHGLTALFQQKIQFLFTKPSVLQVCNFTPNANPARPHQNPEEADKATQQHLLMQKTNEIFKSDLLAQTSSIKERLKARNRSNGSKQLKKSASH